MKKHVHCELIKAWADGAQIQYKGPNDSDWRDAEKPIWLENCEYRLKPKPPVTTYRWALSGRVTGDYITESWYSREEIEALVGITGSTIIGEISETKKIC